jgi:hypothetical protein
MKYLFIADSNILLSSNIAHILRGQRGLNFVVFPGKNNTYDLHIFEPITKFRKNISKTFKKSIQISIKYYKTRAKLQKPKVF